METTRRPEGEPCPYCGHPTQRWKFGDICPKCRPPREYAPLVVELGLPPSAVSPNARVHWSVRAKASKRYRSEALVMALKAGLRSWVACTPTPVRIESEWFCARDPIRDGVCPRDSTNAQACLKAAIDGLVDAGLVPDDSAKWVSLGVPVLHHKKKDHRGRRAVILTIHRAVH